MHRRAASFLPVVRTSAPPWLTFVALVWWMVLSGPAHAQPVARESGLSGFDSRSSIVASDRSPSLQRTDRRHAASSDDGNPVQLATGSVATAAAIPSSIQPTTRIALVAPAAQQPRSPAQPRAPPADA